MHMDFEEESPVKKHSDKQINSLNAKLLTTTTSKTERSISQLNCLTSSSKNIDQTMSSASQYGNVHMNPFCLQESEQSVHGSLKTLALQSPINKNISVSSPKKGTSSNRHMVGNPYKKEIERV